MQGWRRRSAGQRGLCRRGGAVDDRQAQRARGCRLVPRPLWQVADHRRTRRGPIGRDQPVHAAALGTGPCGAGPDAQLCPACRASLDQHLPGRSATHPRQRHRLRSRNLSSGGCRDTAAERQPRPCAGGRRPKGCGALRDRGEGGRSYRVPLRAFERRCGVRQDGARGRTGQAIDPATAPADARCLGQGADAFRLRCPGRSSRAVLHGAVPVAADAGTGGRQRGGLSPVGRRAGPGRRGTSSLRGMVALGQLPDAGAAGRARRARCRARYRGFARRTLPLGQGAMGRPGRAVPERAYRTCGDRPARPAP